MLKSPQKCLTEIGNMVMSNLHPPVFKKLKLPLLSLFCAGLVKLMNTFMERFYCPLPSKIDSFSDLNLKYAGLLKLNFFSFGNGNSSKHHACYWHCTTESFHVNAQKFTFLSSKLLFQLLLL